MDQVLRGFDLLYNAQLEVQLEITRHIPDDARDRRGSAKQLFKLTLIHMRTPSYRERYFSIATCLQKLREALRYHR